MLDASVALRWLFADERSDAADAAFRHADRSGAHAPSLLPAEVANGLNVGLRRGRITEADAYRGVAIVRALPIALDDADAARVLTEVAALARRHELSVYDAIYLELALRLGVPLATFDERLAAAAARSGVPPWRDPAA